MCDLLDRPLQQHDGPCDEIAFLECEANGLPTLSAELVETIRLESLCTLLERTSLLKRNYEVLPVRHAFTVAPRGTAAPEPKVPMQALVAEQDTDDAQGPGGAGSFP